MRFPLTTAATLGLTLLAMLPTAAQEIKIPFTKYQLPNGLVVILHEDHALPLVAVNLWYHVGSKDESPGRSGFAHLFEHLMFTGSKNVPGNKIDILMESAGGWNNASTAEDRTNYYDVGPSHLLETLLWIEADRMATLGDVTGIKQLDVQRDVVRNERRQGVENRPYGRAEVIIPEEMYPPSHPYHSAVIGSHRDLAAATVADVQRFFRRYYVPSNATLVVAGGFKPEQARAWVERYFGWIPAVPRPSHPTTAALQLGQPKVRVVKDRVELPRTYYVYHSPAAYQPDDAEMDLLSRILAGGKNSRLYKSLVYEKQIAQDVSAYQASQSLGSLFQIIVTAKPKRTLSEIERAMDAEIGRLLKEPPTQRELERARNGIETAFFASLEKINVRADTLNAYEFHYRDPGAINNDLARYRAATVASVQRVAAKYLRPQTRFTLRFEPAKLPDKEPPLPAVPADALAAQALPPSIGAVPAQMTTQPQLRPRHKFSAPKPLALKLRSGIPVIVQERHGVPLVSVVLAVRAGAESDPLAQPGLASVTADMLDEGAGQRSALQIADEIDYLGANLSTDADRDGSYVQLDVLKGQLPAALDILADVARRPRFEEREWKRVQNDRIATLIEQRVNPAYVARTVYDRVLYGEAHPYGLPVLGTEAALRGLTVADLRRFHQTWYTPANSALIVVGDVTAKDIRDQLDQRFGDWKADPAAKDAKRAQLDVPAQPLPRITLVDRPAAAQSEIILGRPGVTRADPQYAALLVLNTILGGSFTSRLNHNLREQHGYTYGARSGFAFRRGRGPFWAAAAVKTEVTEDAIRQFLLELDRLTKDEVPTDELAKARALNEGSLPQEFQSNSSVAGLLTGLWVHGLPVGYYRDFAARLRRVSAADVQRLAKKYVAPDGAAIVIVGDRKALLPQLEKLGLKNPALRDTDGTLKK